MKFSVVIPLYKCSSSINELNERLIKVLSKLSNEFEIIYVNDASPENDWEIVTQLSKKDKRVKGINFSRNFGQHYAITAGLDFANGDWVVVMDGDLQDQPEEIIKLYEKAKEGYDVVLAKRISRQDNFLKKLLSKYFYKVLSYLTETKQDYTIANFGIYRKKVIAAILEMKDNLRYFPTMVHWVGFKSTSIAVTHSKRLRGKTSYSLRSLIHLSIDVMLAFSDKPLRLTVKLGFSIALLSIIYAIITLIKYFTGQIEILGWTSMIISIWFLSGVIITVLGIVGLYIGKIFEKVKNRPFYIIDETTLKQ